MSAPETAPQPSGGRLRGMFGHPYMLLTLTALFWGGNGVASKLAVGTISPMLLTTLRWIVVCAALAPWIGRDLVAAWPELKPRWKALFLMGALGFTGFNSLFYLAGHHTTGVNLTLLQGSIPVLVILGAALLFGTPIRLVQVLGMALTLLGVAVTASHGDLATLRRLELNIGDVYVLVACVFYAGYTLALRRRPPLPGLIVFAALAIVACLTSLPLVAWEALNAPGLIIGAKGWLILLYVAFLPSLVAQVFFMRGVELIGPGRAGIFVNLVPVFGALLSVAILGEAFGAYHALALVLVVGGIYVAERGKV